MTLKHCSNGLPGVSEFGIAAEADRPDRMAVGLAQRKPGGDITLHQLFQVGHIAVVGLFHPVVQYIHVAPPAEEPQGDVLRDLQQFRVAFVAGGGEYLSTSYRPDNRRVTRWTAASMQACTIVSSYSAIS